jgi:hypothetical protein
MLELYEQKKDKSMNNKTLLAVLTAGITLTSTGIVPAARAQTRTLAQCSLATVKGSYAIQLTGWYGTGANRLPYASAGTFIADGNGNLSGTETVILDGAAPIQQPVTATYTVNPATCTGSATATDGRTFNFFILQNGKEITNISTTLGTTITGVSKRQ